MPRAEPPRRRGPVVVAAHGAPNRHERRKRAAVVRSAEYRARVAREAARAQYAAAMEARP